MVITAHLNPSRITHPTVSRCYPTVFRLCHKNNLSGKLCFNSLWPATNVTGQGNGLRSRIVREKRGGPGITVKAKQKIIITYLLPTVQMFWVFNLVFRSVNSRVTNEGRARTDQSPGSRPAI